MKACAQTHNEINSVWKNVWIFSASIVSRSLDLIFSHSDLFSIVWPNCSFLIIFLPFLIFFHDIWSFWSFLTSLINFCHLDHFWPLWSFLIKLAIFYHFDHFLPFLPLSWFWSFWSWLTIFAHFAHFCSFLLILPLSTTFDIFWSNCSFLTKKFKTVIEKNIGSRE